jgi:hypothetical protein
MRDRCDTEAEQDPGAPGGQPPRMLQQPAGLDDPSVMAGAGTVALELLRQVPNLAMILTARCGPEAGER